MAVGKGKYDDALTLALEFSYAQEGILVVFNGKGGSGFSVHGSKLRLEKIPEILEHIAKEMRKDLPDLT